MPKAPKPSGRSEAKKRPKQAASRPDGSGGNGRKRAKKNGAGTAVAEDRVKRAKVDEAGTHGPAGPKTDLSEDQRVLLGDLFAVIEEHAEDAVERVDRDKVQEAFVFACERHVDQRRASGEEFIVHPIGVAKICAGMRLDTATLCAALLHDTVEDTSASLAEVRGDFGDEVAGLVDGVTKLTGITFQSRDEAQAENYRKMMIARATAIRGIRSKLADRRHNR